MWFLSLFNSAYRQGVRAAQAGQSKSSNPYRSLNLREMSSAARWIQGWIAGGGIEEIVKPKPVVRQSLPNIGPALPDFKNKQYGQGLAHIVNEVVVKVSR